MSTEIVLFEITNPLQVFGTQKGLDAIIDKIEADVKTIDRDISTEAGRDNIRSVAFKLAKSKKEIERMGLALTEGWRDQTALVNAEKKRAAERMQRLQDEIRKPLTDWEDAEKARVSCHEVNIKALTDSLIFSCDPTVEVLTLQISTNQKFYDSLEWEEFAVRAKIEHDRVQTALAGQLGARVKSDSDAAELSRLKAEEAARLQADRDAKIAADAKEKAELAAILAAAILAAVRSR